MILEHRSNKLPREGATLDPNRIGENPVTQRDLKESKIPRSYFTVRGRKVEHHFEGMPVYAAHVPDEHVYDAHKDPEGLVDKWAGRGWHVDHLINNVKAAGYKGIKWQDGATVAMFHPVAVTPIDPIPKEKRHRTEMLRHFVAGYKRLGGTDVRKAIAAFKAHPKFSSWFDANEAGREAVQLARYQAPAEGAVVNNGFAKGGQFMSAPRASVRDVMRRLRMMKPTPVKLARIEHPTFAGLVEAIHQRPHDQLGYLMLSDFVEERGHEKEAGLLRKIVHHGGVNDVVTLHAQPSGNHYPLPDYGYGFSAHRAGPGIHPMMRSMIGQSHTQSPRPGAVIHGGGDKSLFLPLHPPYDAKDDAPF